MSSLFRRLLLVLGVLLLTTPLLFAPPVGRGGGGKGVGGGGKGVGGGGRIGGGGHVGGGHVGGGGGHGGVPPKASGNSRWGGARPVRVAVFGPHVETVREVERRTHERPVEAIETLGRSGNDLPASERARLALDAFDALGERIEKTADPARSLAELYRAREAGRDLPPTFRMLQDGVQQRAERKAILRILREAEALAQAGKAAEARRKAEIYVQYGAGSETTQAAARQMASALRQVEALAAVKGATQRGGGWSDVQTRDLPGAIFVPASGLRGLRVLGEASRAGGKPDGLAVRRAARDYADATGEPGRARRIQQDLSAKAFLEGHASEAREMLPGEGEPQHAAALLRDMKRLLNGEGKLESPAVQQVLFGREPGEEGAGRPRDPPPGVEPMTPEVREEGWRSPQFDERVADDLGPIEEAQKRDAPELERRVQTELPRETVAAEQRATASRGHLSQTLRQLQTEDDADEKFIAEVEARLGRKLSPCEKGLVVAMRNKYSVSQVVEMLGQLDEVLVRMVGEDRAKEAR